MRADRLITMLLLLQQRGRMTSRELADRLEVSQRTVFRDIDALGAAGVPIYSVRGADGGFELWRGFRAQLSGVSGREAAALLLLNHPRIAEALGAGAARASLHLKLMAALPPDLVTRYETTGDELYVVPRPSPPDGLRLTLRTLRTAIARRRALLVEHTSGGEAWVLHPLGLVVSGSRWHLVADSKGELCSYPVDTLRPLRTTGATFTRPEGFDLRQVWTSLEASPG